MRSLLHVFMILLFCASVPVAAEDQLPVAAEPAWVVPVDLPTAQEDAGNMAVSVLLFDQQTSMSSEATDAYSRVVVKIQNPQGLSAGNLNFSWRPDIDRPQIHKVLIRRGDEVIDVLASGQAFTVLRREQNLEMAMLDGVLTATLMPTGLQVGDIVDFSSSIRTSDPVMKGHAESIIMPWDLFPAAKSHFRVEWPVGHAVRLRQNGSLPAIKPKKSGNKMVAELTLENSEPIPPPKGAPDRYMIGRAVEFSDYASWADLAKLMKPLYVEAARLPASGPLRVEFDRIAASSTDPKARTEAALALVQDKIRYVALAMGTGGYVPTDAETTWARRYGDCKAKTAMLLALLEGLGVKAEPVLVNSILGDGMDSRLPMLGLFNHVIVRAEIEGKTYWLDGTRTGDKNLERIATPSFIWGLPVDAPAGKLVSIQPGPLSEPKTSTSIHMDASEGIALPAPTKIETIMRGDGAISLNAAFNNLPPAARDKAIKDYWKNRYDFIDVKTTSLKFDERNAELRLGMEGMAKMQWDDGWYETDDSSVGYEADFERDEGLQKDAPYAVSHPFYSHVKQVIILPPGFDRGNLGEKNRVDEKVAGMEYRRIVTVEGPAYTIETTKRSTAPEFAASEAAAAQAKLRELYNNGLYLRRPDNYVATAKELDAMGETTPKTASEYFERGRMYLEHQKYDEAIADFNDANRLEPKDIWPIANRAIAYAWNKNFDAANKDIAAGEAIGRSNPVLLRAKGLIAEFQGNHAAAVDAYSEALKLEPTDGFSLVHRAQVNRAAGNKDAALADATAALKVNPGWSDLYLMKATIYREKGERENGLAEAAAIIAANPKSHFAYVAAANIYDAFGDTTRALAAYDQAIEIKPEAYIYLNRGVRRPKSDLAGRTADIDQAFKLSPEDIDIQIAKAELLAEQKDYVGAIAIYSSALGKAPEYAALYGSRGLAYARAGDSAKADSDFAQARSKSDNPSQLNALCWHKATEGIALQAALADCNLALEKMPGTMAFLDSRALVYLRLGELDKAISDYDSAIEKSPEAVSLYGRAIAWARKGDKAKSDADAAKAKSINPDIAARFKDFGLEL